MSIVTKACKQDIIRWSYTGRDEYGQAQFAAPVASKARWEDTAEEQISADGTRFVTRSKALVLLDMHPGDYLELALLDSNTPLNPKDSEEAYPIKSFAKIPNKKGKTFVRWAYM